MERVALYRAVWRWHFYAGLCVLPVIVVLSITGGMYLFKAEVERWEERSFHGLPNTAVVAPSAQVSAALTAFPGARLLYYRLPERAGDAAAVRLRLDAERGERDVFVSPSGAVLGALDPHWRVMRIARDIHGQLLIGPQGSWLVELAASWAIVMLLTGMYLWWPRGRGAAGVVWPRLQAGGRVVLRDLHAVTGFWVSGLALVLLVTGLPWADVWGSGFKLLREQMGWVKGEQDWTIGGRIAADEHANHVTMQSTSTSAVPSVESLALLDRLVASASAEGLAFPTVVTPPGAPLRFGAKPDLYWTVRSDSQNRPLRITLKYDAGSGVEMFRESFADKHVIDRVIGYGVAWHEGHLFGWVNQLIGVVTVIALAGLAITSFLMWRKRKPKDALGAPPRAGAAAPRGLVIGGIVVLAALLPLFGVSVLAILALEKFVLRRNSRLASWLGLRGRRSDLRSA